MKKKYKVLLFVIVFTNFLFAQKGTIKIAKSENREEGSHRPFYNRFLIGVGANYTFKENNKIGCDVEVLISFKQLIGSIGWYIGIKYTMENQYYQLSPFNFKTLQTDVGLAKSHNNTRYFKMPLMLRLPIGRKIKLGVVRGEKFIYSDNILFLIGLESKCLLKNYNNRLANKDFNKFNLSGNIGIDFRIKGKFSVCFIYSRDFFENLKDRTIYNSNREIVGKQKSKTNLISLQIRYRMG